MMPWICDAVALHQKIGRQASERTFQQRGHRCVARRTNTLGEWHGHLLVLDRRQCVLFCHNLMRWPALFMTVRREIGKPHGESGARRPEVLSRTSAVRRGSEGRARRLKVCRSERLKRSLVCTSSPLRLLWPCCTSVSLRLSAKDHSLGLQPPTFSNVGL